MGVGPSDTPGEQIEEQQTTIEQRQHNLVERYTDDDGLIRVGTVYFRNLIP
jgi:hypothetical protein